MGYLYPFTFEHCIQQFILLHFNSLSEHWKGDACCIFYSQSSTTNSNSPCIRLKMRKRKKWAVWNANVENAWLKNAARNVHFFRILPLYFRFRISSVSLYLQSTVTRKNDRQKWKDFLKYKRRFSLARLHFGIWQSMLVRRCLTLNCPITGWYYVPFLALHTLLLDRRSRGRSRKRWIENIIRRIWSK